MIACILLGAAINVLVAWGCALWSKWDDSGGWGALKSISDSDRDRIWGRYSRSGWPDRKGFFDVEHRGFGIRSQTMWTSKEAMKPTLLEENDARAIFFADWHIIEFQAGWPCVALRCAQRFETNRSSKPELLSGIAMAGNARLGISDGHWLPYGPIWTGLIINTIFYAATLWMLIRGPWETRRRWREWRRRCGWCNYPFGDSAVCAECGKPKPTWTAGDAPPSSAR